ncbi:hypothetical protein DFQ26_000241, partial [Actinomortierella ambigua]
KPLPFQIQRQTQDLQVSKGAVASMSLASIPSSGGPNPATPGANPPAPPGSSPATAAVVAAPPFRDVVLSVNTASSAQAWHVKAPGRGVPPGSTYSNPLAPLWGASKMSSLLFPNAISISLGIHTPLGSKPPGILAVIQLSAGPLQLTRLEYPPGSVNVGSPTSPSTQAPSSAPSSAPLSGGDGISNTTVAEQPVPWKESWAAPAPIGIWSFSQKRPELVFHPTTVPASFRGTVGFSEAVAGQCGQNTEAWCLGLLEDPPQSSTTDMDPRSPMPQGACFTSTSGEVVAVVGDKVYINKFGSTAEKWDLVAPANAAPSFKGPVAACTTSNNYVIAIIPDSTGQARPEIHLFDLSSKTWAKSQLVPAPNGTFSDMPSPPPIPTPSPSPGNSNRPGKGDPGEGGGGPDHSDDPSTMDPSAANTTTSRAALIGGIVGGIVVLGALIFAGFFFSRRRGTKKKGQHQSEFALKSLNGNDGLHNKQRLHDRETSSRGDGRSLESNDYQEKAWPSESYRHEIALSQAQATARPRTNNPQAAYPLAINQHEIASLQAGSPQETTQSRIVNSQDKTWSPSSNYHLATSPRTDSPRKMTRSRVNSPQEMTQVMVPVVHRANNPQYDPNQQL